MTDPVIELQERVTYQDSVISDLDQVVRDFAARVELLERQLKTLQERVDELPEAGGTQDPPPPHY